VTAILWDEQAQDIDVDALHGGRLRALRRAKGQVVTETAVKRGARVGGVWRLEAGEGAYEAPTIVVAAGAWSDRVAASCGVAPVGLQPKRRSAAIIAGPAGNAVADWPEISPVDVSFYAKPTGGKLMLSPADEDPAEPHDAWADDMRLAEAAAALEEMVDMQVQRMERTWGGLRTFAPDGLPRWSGSTPPRTASSGWRGRAATAFRPRRPCRDSRRRWSHAATFRRISHAPASRRSCCRRGASGNETRRRDTHITNRSPSLTDRSTSQRMKRSCLTRSARFPKTGATQRSAGLNG
jgi:glycine/D-amino acid oxidase-like deaminating enzyme